MNGWSSESMLFEFDVFSLVLFKEEFLFDVELLCSLSYAFCSLSSLFELFSFSLL